MGRGLECKVRGDWERGGMESEGAGQVGVAMVVKEQGEKGSGSDSGGLDLVGCC